MGADRGSRGREVASGELQQGYRHRTMLAFYTHVPAAEVYPGQQPPASVRTLSSVHRGPGAHPRQAGHAGQKLAQLR